MIKLVSQNSRKMAVQEKEIQLVNRNSFLKVLNSASSLLVFLNTSLSNHRISSFFMIGRSSPHYKCRSCGTFLPLSRHMKRLDTSTFIHNEKQIAQSESLKCSCPHEIQ